jgi:hypothetical protein
VVSSSDTVLKNRKAKIDEANLKKFDDHLKNFNDKFSPNTSEKTDHTIYKIVNTTTGTPQLVTNPFVLPSTSKNTYGYDYQAMITQDNQF